MYRTIAAMNKARKQAMNAGKHFLITAMDFIKQEQPGVMAVMKRSSPRGYGTSQRH